MIPIVLQQNSTIWYHFSVGLAHDYEGVQLQLVKLQLCNRITVTGHQLLLCVKYLLLFPTVANMIKYTTLFFIIERPPNLNIFWLCDLLVNWNRVFLWFEMKHSITKDNSLNSPRASEIHFDCYHRNNSTKSYDHTSKAHFYNDRYNYGPRRQEIMLSVNHNHVIS